MCSRMRFVFHSGTDMSLGLKSGNRMKPFAKAYLSAVLAPLWTNRYNGPANGNDYAQALVVDGSGNVFVAGYSPGIGSGNDYATLAYSGAGVPLWTNRYSANNDDRAVAMGVDFEGNVFVTGYSTG